MKKFRMTLPLPTFTGRLASQIRYATRKIPDFRDGAIVIRYVGLCEDANYWLNMPVRQNDDPKVDLDYVFPAQPGGRKTRAAGWRDNPENLELSCAGVAMDMIEGCARAIVRNLGRCSDDLPDLYLTPGSSNRQGALCFDIDVPRMAEEEDSSLKHGDTFLRIYVAVCGATPEEDKRCAYEAFAVLRHLLSGTDACIVSPSCNPEQITIVE